MSHRFDNFDNTSEGYIPCNRPWIPMKDQQTNATYSLSAEHSLVTARDEFIGIQFNYGEAADIVFKTTGFVLDDDKTPMLIEDYLEEHPLKITLYNHFFTPYKELPLYSIVSAADGLYIMVHIDNDASLIKGVYHIGIKSDEDVIYSPKDSIINIL